MKKLTSFLQKPQEQIVKIVAAQSNCSVYSRSQRLVFVEKFNFSQSEEKKTCDRLRAVQTQYTDATKLCLKNQNKQKLPKKSSSFKKKNLVKVSKNGLIGRHQGHHGSLGRWPTSRSDEGNDPRNR